MGAPVVLPLAPEAVPGHAPGPDSVGVVPTNACNLRCVTCWSYSPLRPELPSADWRRRRLERDTLAALFDDLAALRTRRVIFTGGGDPLAHPEMLDILADAKAAGLKTTLISNLTLARDPDRLRALRPDTIQANFSGADAPTYRAFHPGRTDDDYARLCRLLTDLADAGSEVKLVFVVCAVNAHALEAAVDQAARMGAAIQFKAVSVTPDTRSLALDEATRAAILGSGDALRAHAARRGVRANVDALLRELSGATPERFPIEQVGCRLGRRYARVDAAGTVRYCCNPHAELAIGSLHEHRFADLWRGARWEALRARLARDEFLPGCERCGKFDLNLKLAQEAS